MIFPKPKLKYTEMAMYIDDRVNSGDNLTESEIETIYIYLYHLVRMLAYTKKYFNKTEYYDEFSLTVAGDMMNRLIYNPKLHELDESGELKMGPLKSVLNYLKVILYGRKVDFEQKTYSQKISKDSDDIVLTDLSFANQIKNTKRDHINSNIKLYLGDLGKTLDTFIDEKCEFNDYVINKNIKISCFISILNSIIFTQQVKDNINNKYKTVESKFNYLCVEYATNRKNCITLYHLDESFRNYVTILVRRIFNLIEKDLKELSVGDNYISDNVLADIAFAELDGIDVYDD